MQKEQSVSLSPESWHHPRSTESLQEFISYLVSRHDDLSVDEAATTSE